METIFFIAQIIVALVLTGLILLQTQNSGAGSMFGNDTTVYRTKRGLEKTLYQATIVLSAVFFLLAMVSVRLAG